MHVVVKTFFYLNPFLGGTVCYLKEKLRGTQYFLVTSVYKHHTSLRWLIRLRVQKEATAFTQPSESHVCQCIESTYP